MEHSRLELMLIHLLNTRAPDGKLWKAISLPEYGRFTFDDVKEELEIAKAAKTRWWEFWKR